MLNMAMSPNDKLVVCGSAPGLHHHKRCFSSRIQQSEYDSPSRTQHTKSSSPSCWVNNSLYMYKKTKFAILLLCVICVNMPVCCGGVSTARVTVSSPKTWADAAADNTCPLFGSQLNGSIVPDQIPSDVVNSKVWIGAHVERFWITFMGCFYGHFLNNQSNFISTGNDPVKSCLLHCKLGAFVLTQYRCCCAKDVHITGDSCISQNCQKTTKPLCGSPKHSGIYCMCGYSKADLSSPILGTGNCITAKYIGNNMPRYKADDCTSKHEHVCCNRSSPLSPIYVQSLSTWTESLIHCSSNTLQFPGIGRVHAIPTTTVVWIGSFAVSFIKWGIGSSGGHTCVAVMKTSHDNTVRIQQVPCTRIMPALCGHSSGVTISTPRVPETSQTVFITARMDSQPESSNIPVAAVVGPVLGVLLLGIFLVIAFLSLRRRRRLLFKSRLPEDMSTDRIGVIGSGETRDNVRHTEAPDYVYNELNKQTNRTASGLDMYDQTFLDASRTTYGHLSAGNYQYARNNEYDHTFTGATGDAYGHLNKGQSDDGSEYDHVFREQGAERVSHFDQSTSGELTNARSGMHDDVTSTTDIEHVYAQVVKKPRPDTSNKLE